MASGSSMFDKLQKLPKWQQYLIIGLVSAVFIFSFVWFGLGLGNKKPAEPVTQSVTIDMPDPDVRDDDRTRMQTYDDDRFLGNGVTDYWSSLGDDGDNDASLVSSSPTLESNDDLDPAVYSKLEIYYIRNGIKTRAQVDAEKAQEAAEREARERRWAEDSRASSASRPMTQAQQDSQYFAMLEKSYKMAAKYSAPKETAAPAQSSQPAAVSEPEPEEEQPEDRRIDLGGGNTSLPMDSFGDGIISSLDTPSDDGIVHYGSSFQARPVKATFLKTEKLTSGQRVIIRLMQDMTLSDGTTIPANTHITGTCTISQRLKIDVTVLHYNGRMFPTDISAYDNDGMEGIYCPAVERKGGKKAKDVAGGLVGGVASAVGTVMTGSPIIGSMAQRGISAATSSLNSDGTVSVSVSSGYEFYVYENIPKEKQQNDYR